MHGCVRRSIGEGEELGYGPGSVNGLWREDEVARRMHVAVLGAPTSSSTLHQFPAPEDTSGLLQCDRVVAKVTSRLDYATAHSSVPGDDQPLEETTKSCHRTQPGTRKPGVRVRAKGENPNREETGGIGGMRSPRVLQV